MGWDDGMQIDWRKGRFGDFLFPGSRKNNEFLSKLSDNLKHLMTIFTHTLRI